MIQALIDFLLKNSISNVPAKWVDFIAKVQSMGCNTVDDMYNLSQQDKDALVQWIQTDLGVDNFDAYIGMEFLLGIVTDRTHPMELAVDCYCKKSGNIITAYVLLYDGTELDLATAKQQFGFDTQLHIHDRDNQLFSDDGSGAVDVSSSNYTNPEDFFYALHLGVSTVRGALFTGQPQ